MTTQEAIEHLELAREVNDTGAAHQATLYRYHQGSNEAAAFVAKCSEVEQLRASVALSLALDALREKLHAAERTKGRP